MTPSHAHACTLSRANQTSLQRLPERLAGYARWLPADYRIVVLLDRDDDDCHELKREMEATASRAGPD